MGRADCWAKVSGVAVVAALVALDLTQVRRSEGVSVWQLPEVDTSRLGEATVAIACSQCEALAQPAPRDVALTYEQVDDLVKLALHRDTSERNLARVVEPGDWVAIKVNIVTAPLIVNGRKRTAFWDKGTAHWGQVTDLRVVKSVIDYLVREERDARRITVVEGGAEWNAVGQAGAETGQTEDGWSVHWEEFDGLSYADLVAAYDGVNGIQVDIVDLNYDDWVGSQGVRAGDPLPVPDPRNTGITWYQRPEGFYVSKTLLEVDKLVNVAAMKTHDIPGVTLLHKQYVGTLMQRAYGELGNSKMDLHRFGNDRVPWGFVDLFSYRPTDYGILEGLWGTEGAGPQWGTNVQHNVIIAGGDPVAVDAVGATVMGFNPKDLVFLRLSAAKGFGTYDLDHIHVIGDSVAGVERDFEKTPGNPFWGWGNRRWLVNGPYEAADLESAPLVDEATLVPQEGQVTNGITWRRVESSDRLSVLPEDYVNASSVTYAYATILSAEAQDGFLYLGADDGAKVWLNGHEVYAAERMEALPTSARIPVSLGAGPNTVMVKVRNRFGRAGLCLVAGDEDGDTLPGVEYTLAAAAPITAVLGTQAQSVPSQFHLGLNYPNPFNAETVIPFSLPGATDVQLVICDARGARVRTAVDTWLPGGTHTARWDGRDEEGHEVASGVYVYTLRIDAGRRAGRMVLLR